MLPTVPLGNVEITRLLIGGNPFSGNSHVNRAMDEEMMNFYTTEQIKRTLFRCMECGINTVQARGDKHIMRILREFRSEGGKLHWIAQSASELRSFEVNVKQMAEAGAAAIYHHGTRTDQFFKDGQQDEVAKNLAIIRKTGLPVGLATHMPEVIKYAEDNNWDLDFYMTCVYNISRKYRESSAVTGIANEDEAFFEEDIPIMYKTIRSVDKPCITFKILGATRRCQNQDTVKAAFTEAFQNIKPKDVVLVGVYPKTRDEVALNAQYTREALGVTG